MNYLDYRLYNAELMNYQREGVTWMRRREMATMSHDENLRIRGGVLADEMGLGKTLQTICLVKNCPYRTLICVQNATLEQWIADFEKYAGITPVALTVRSIRAGKRIEDDDKVVILTHTCFSKLVGDDLQVLVKRKFHRVVVDEAHPLKNSSSFTENLNSLMANIKWCVTATPVVSKKKDLVKLFTFISGGKDSALEMYDNRHFYLKRRECVEVGKTDMPDLDAFVETIDLEDYERYTTLYREGKMLTANVEDLEDDLLEDSDVEVNAANVLTVLTWMRQLCERDASKLEDLLQRHREHPSRTKALVFVHFHDTIDAIRSALEREGGVEVLEYSGRISDKERAEVRVRLLDPEATVTVILQIKCAGVGLNMQTANYVYLMSPHWNLAMEEQAIGRARRMGSPHALVHCIRYVAKSTVEEYMRLRHHNQRIAQDEGFGKDISEDTIALKFFKDERFIV